MNQGLKSLIQPLLYLVLLNLLPQIYLRPFWIAAISFVLVGFRLWIEVTKRRPPPRWLMLILQVVIGLAVWQHYHSFLGDEAGGAFLTLLTCLKVFELRRLRDFFVTAVLCILVLMSYLLLDQGLTMTFFMLVDLVAIATFFQALQEEQWSWKLWRKKTKPSIALALKALPLVVLMFILFPRFNTGFGHGGAAKGKTGITDSLRPGSIEELASSDELIFRASFLDGNFPPPNQLYWRGAVLDQSNGLNWDRNRQHVNSLPINSAPPDPDLEIYLEPGSERFLFSLDNTAALGFPNGAGFRTQVRDGKIFELSEPLQTRSRYYIQRGERPTMDGDPNDFLTIQENPSRELRKFLQKYQGKSASEAVRQLLTYFHEGGYKYSLKPPTSNSLDEFLFKNKIGFCEHYAGTLATLLRDLKIPSRVVVGFQGGTRSFFDNYVSVRGHDAHSWVEYYDKANGRWRRVDPTSEVEPLRATEGSRALFRDGRDLMPSWMPSQWLRQYLRSRAFVDEVEASWISFLLRFDLARQRELLARLGMEDVLFRALAVFLLLSTGLILAVFYFFEAQRREPLSDDEKLYRQLIAALKKWKIQKAANEGPLSLLAKARTANSRLAEGVEPILSLLINVRYGRAQLSREKIVQMKRQIRYLRKIRP